MASFDYDELRPGCIRLLRVLSCAHNVIELEMKQSDARYTDVFFALSYVWGTALPNSRILLNNHQAAVRPNLFAALKAIHNASAKPEYSSEALWVWIDAICINQEDYAEKLRQIPLMGDIYSKAEQVLVWLGDAHTPIVVDTLLWIDAKLSLQGAKEQADREHWLVKLDEVRSRLEARHILGESEAEAIWMLYSIPLDYRNFGSAKTGRDCVRNWLSNHMNSHSSGLFTAKHQFWAGLETLTDNKWHQRAWTYQEISLARNARILFTDSTVNYWPLEQLTWIRDEIRSFGQPRLEIEARCYHYVLLASLYLPNVYRTKTQWPLALHLITTRLRQATDDRDLVYALLGITGEETRRRIRVDYTLPSNAVFANAICVAIEESPELLPGIWEALPMPITETETLPSWCPDLSISNDEMDAIGSHLTTISQTVGNKGECYVSVKSDGMYQSLSFGAWHIDTVLYTVGKVPNLELDALSSDNEPAEPLTLVAAKLGRLTARLTRWLRDFDNTFFGRASTCQIARLQSIMDFILCPYANLSTGDQWNAQVSQIFDLCHLAAVQDFGNAYHAIGKPFRSDVDYRAMQRISGNSLILPSTGTFWRLPLGNSGIRNWRLRSVTS